MIEITSRAQIERKIAEYRSLSIRMSQTSVSSICVGLNSFESKYEHDFDLYREIVASGCELSSAVSKFQKQCDNLKHQPNDFESVAYVLEQHKMLARRVSRYGRDIRRTLAIIKSDKKKLYQFLQAIDIKMPSKSTALLIREKTVKLTEKFLVLIEIVMSCVARNRDTMSLMNNMLKERNIASSWVVKYDNGQIIV